MQTRFKDMEFNFRNRKYPMLFTIASLFVVFFSFYSAAMSLRVVVVETLLPSDFGSNLDFLVYYVLMLGALGCLFAMGAVLGAWGLLLYQERMRERV
jgi:hypothetical protein